MLLQRKKQRRGGATTVEFAFVAILLFLMLFGIFEYGRFLFVYHMTTNAARDAARFAAVKTGGGTMPGEPTAVTTADVQEVWRSGMFNGQSYGTGMCGMENQISGYVVNVFAVPDASLYASPPDLTAAGKPAWNTATFHQQIAVQVTGSYMPVVPNLLGLNSSVPFTVTVLMGSEAN
ncbi:MAG TPA: TadE family protein [Gemmataceae bacterium]|jgi:Flp pilus assembly protein TadG|nr:TadE family protein [Gemmataceae bacterium]